MEIESIKTVLNGVDREHDLHIEMTKDGINIWGEMTTSTIHLSGQLLMECINFVGQMRNNNQVDDEDLDDLI